MADQSLRGFLEMVERDFPEELVRIKEPVERTDITPTVFEFERAGRSPVIVFERVEGFEHSVVTNIAGNRKLLAVCLGVEPGELPAAYKDRCQNYFPVEIAESARRCRPEQAADTVSFSDRCRALHHGGADRRP